MIPNGFKWLEIRTSGSLVNVVIDCLLHSKVFDYHRNYLLLNRDCTPWSYS